MLCLALQMLYNSVRGGALSLRRTAACAVFALLLAHMQLYISVCAHQRHVVSHALQKRHPLHHSVNMLRHPPFGRDSISRRRTFNSRGTASGNVLLAHRMFVICVLYALHPICGLDVSTSWPDVGTVCHAPGCRCHPVILAVSFLSRPVVG
jgi:hypothetical protein